MSFYEAMLYYVFTMSCRYVTYCYYVILFHAVMTLCHASLSCYITMLFTDTMLLFYAVVLCHVSYVCVQSFRRLCSISIFCLGCLDLSRRLTGSLWRSCALDIDEEDEPDQNDQPNNSTNNGSNDPQIVGWWRWLRNVR